MSDYTKTTNFTAKDALSTGDPNKLIKGALFDTEFDAIATAIATKYDSGNAMLADLDALSDPGADRIVFWDDSDGALEWLVATNGLEISVNDLGLADVAAAAGLPIAITSGVFDFDLTALDNIEGNALAYTDEFLVDDGGTPKAVAVGSMGMRVQTSQTTQTLALADANSIMEFNGTATVTIPANAAVAWPIGACVLLVVDHATQVVTVTADTGVTLNSVNHPGGGSAASDTVLAGGTAVLVKTETNEWYLAGDIAD